MEHNRKLNFTIPLYFDNSVSYLELVGHLFKGFKDVTDEFEIIKEEWSNVQTEFSIIKQDWQALLEANEQFKVDMGVRADAFESEMRQTEAQHIADMGVRADAFEAEMRAKQEQHEQVVSEQISNISSDVTVLQTTVQQIENGTIVVENAENAEYANNAGYANTAGQADKLTTARTIALSGDVTGSTSFDGSSDVTINCVVSGASDVGKLPGRVSVVENTLSTLEGKVSTIENTEIPGIKSRLDALEDVHEYGTSVPTTLASGHIYFQIPEE